MKVNYDEFAFICELMTQIGEAAPRLYQRMKYNPYWKGVLVERCGNEVMEQLREKVVNNDLSLRSNMELLEMLDSFSVPSFMVFYLRAVKDQQWLMSKIGGRLTDTASRLNEPLVKAIQDIHDRVLDRLEEVVKLSSRYPRFSMDDGEVYDIIHAGYPELARDILHMPIEQWELCSGDAEFNQNITAYAELVDVLDNMIFNNDSASDSAIRSLSYDAYYYQRILIDSNINVRYIIDNAMKVISKPFPVKYANAYIRETCNRVMMMVNCKVKRKDRAILTYIITHNMLNHLYFGVRDGLAYLYPTGCIDLHQLALPAPSTEVLFGIENADGVCTRLYNLTFGYNVTFPNIVENMESICEYLDQCVEQLVRFRDAKNIVPDYKVNKLFADCGDVPKFMFQNTSPYWMRDMLGELLCGPDMWAWMQSFVFTKDVDETIYGSRMNRQIHPNGNQTAFNIANVVKYRGLGTPVEDLRYYAVQERFDTRSMDKRNIIRIEDHKPTTTRKEGGIEIFI